MTLLDGTPGTSYEITSIDTDDDELNHFLFSLGCYEGEMVGLISITGSNMVISIRDGRYNIDKQLAQTIICKG